MELQRFNALTLFIFLITAISTYGMEKNNHVSLNLEEASTYNSRHSLICLSLELQQQIVFPCDTITEITEGNADKLNEQIKTFFSFNRVCKYFKEKFKFPWSNLTTDQKNKMLQEVNVLMTKSTLKECSIINLKSVCCYQHPEKVSFGYKKYRVIPLALVCSGADADVTDRTASTTTICKATQAQDVLAVDLLLKHKADPYQMSFDEHHLASIMLNKTTPYQVSYADAKIPICFLSPTAAIVELFLAKMDKQTLLDMPISEYITALLVRNFCSPEVVKIWLEYGINTRYIEGDKNILHLWIDYYYREGRYAVDNFLKKLELLLNAACDMVNVKEFNGGFYYPSNNTAIDLAESLKEQGIFGALIFKLNSEDHEKIIVLLRKHGGKTAQGLESESAIQ